MVTKPDYTLKVGIESHSTVIPIPISMAVQDKATNRFLGYIDVEEVRKKLAEWDRMVAAHNSRGDS